MPAAARRTPQMTALDVGLRSMTSTGAPVLPPDAEHGVRWSHHREVLVPLFEMTREDLVEGKPVTFAHLEIKEREGLQLPPDEAIDISTEVRILLVAGDFSREITTAVLWLNRFDGMDIRCVQLVAYEINGRNYLDIEQVIPLPQAADYQVQIQKKDQQQE